MRFSAGLGSEDFSGSDFGAGTCVVSAIVGGLSSDLFASVDDE